MKIREVHETLRMIQVSELLTDVQNAGSLYMRLVQVHATTVESRVELNYCFATADTWLNLRLMVEPDQKVPSISRTYPCAFIYENEIHDLFGVHFSDINIDYQGKLYRLRQQMPFAPVTPASDRQEGES